MDRYLVSEYHDFDLNKKAEIVLDLAKPLPSKYQDRATCVINAGTFEAIFDQRQVFENMHAMATQGGTLIHLVPTTWYNHGFYNIDPLLFRSLWRENGYEVLVEAYHSKTPLFGETDSEGAHCYMARVGGKVTPYSKAFDDLHYASTLPANLLYMVCLKKVGNSAFKVPYDIAFDHAHTAPQSSEPSVTIQSKSMTPMHVVLPVPEKVVVQTPASPVNVEEPIPAAIPENLRKLTVRELLSDVPMVRFTIPSSEILPESGFCFAFSFRTNAAKYFARALTGGDFTLLEDGKPLASESALHEDITNLGKGRVSLWRDRLLFSTSDNSDPRENGRKYSFDIPAFVQFLEQLPPAGIRKFQV